MKQHHTRSPELFEALLKARFRATSREETEALDRGDTASAISDLERAAELMPHASEIQNHLGLAYAADGREDAALLAFRRAVALDCRNRAAQRNLRAAEAHAISTSDP